jgi:hypothetical protein
METVLKKKKKRRAFYNFYVPRTSHGRPTRLQHQFRVNPWTGPTTAASIGFFRGNAVPQSNHAALPAGCGSYSSSAVGVNDLASCLPPYPSVKSLNELVFSHGRRTSRDEAAMDGSRRGHFGCVRGSRAACGPWAGGAAAGLQCLPGYALPCSLCSGDGVRVCAGQVSALETPFASRNSFSKVALTGQCRTRTATPRGSKASVHTTNRQ